jgi:hypothetical protein
MKRQNAGRHISGRMCTGDPSPDFGPGLRSLGSSFS